MSAPLPPAETAEETMRRADAEIAALRRTKATNAAQARVRSAELMTLQQTQLEAARKVVAANAQKRIANGNNNASAGGMSGFTEKHPVSQTGFTEKQVKTVIKIMATVLRPHFDAYDKRLGSLEASQLTDGGVWKPEKEFRPNQLATYRGGIWICLRANTDERPGKSDGAWRLMHKTEDGGR